MKGSRQSPQIPAIDRREPRQRATGMCDSARVCDSRMSCVAGTASVEIQTLSANVTGTLSGSLAAGGFSIPFMRTDGIGDSVTGFGDLIPQASLKWNQGVHNFMTYMTGDIPVGA